jgi:1-acyl-sn-glycerol-3-phosphate acyltransferase
MKTLVGVFGLIWKIYILIVFSVTALLFYPLITPFLNTEKNKRRAYKLFVAWSWLFRLLGFYFIRYHEKQALPNGAFLLVANHASYLDIFILPSMFPKSHFVFLGKSEILGYPLIRAYFKNFNIPVYRENKLKAARSVVQAVEVARKGWSVLVFPEGGISDVQRPHLDPFKMGAFQIAKSAKLPIVCLTFVNNFKLFSEPFDLLGPARPGISHVYRHQFIPLEVVESKSAVELSQLCYSLIRTTLLRHYPDMK